MYVDVCCFILRINHSLHIHFPSDKQFNYLQERCNENPYTLFCLAI